MDNIKQKNMEKKMQNLPTQKKKLFIQEEEQNLNRSKFRLNFKRLVKVKNLQKIELFLTKLKHYFDKKFSKNKVQHNNKYQIEEKVLKV